MMYLSQGGNRPPRTEGANIMAKVSYTTASLTTEIGAPNAKELRKFLRSDLSGIESVGKGGRYNIELTATQLTKLKKNWSSWTEQQEIAKIERANAKIAAAVEEAAQGAVTEADIAELDEEYTNEEGGDDEPTDEEIAEIELDVIDDDEVPPTEA
jgi:hypothetical protein